MSIQVPITKEDLKRLTKALKGRKVIICLDEATYIKTLLVAQELLSSGRMVAEVKKGY